MPDIITVKPTTEFRQLIPFDKSKLKVLSDATRLAILQLLTEKPLSIGDLEEELKNQDIIKSTNTIRHHVDVLKKSGFVNLIGLKESRGGVLKYYQSNSQILNHALSEEKMNDVQEISTKLKPEFNKLFNQILIDKTDEINEIAKSLMPCDKCDSSHFRDYVLTQIVLAGIVNFMDQQKLKLS
ncbi:MAG: winged helix-turn-helix transcriptional regulator [Candidatus Heimdallarchaeota archaeon]|nr:winged helix-turn-helix transcriptional regulator [Candidatus Heimdallarchaeota archaeon]